MNENETPQPVSPDAQTQRMPEQPAATAPGPEKPQGRKRALLIGAAAVVALLAVGGGAYAIGANVADDDDDRPAAVAGSDSGRGTEDGDRDGDSQDDRAGSGADTPSDRDGDGAQNTPGGVPASDDASLRAAAEKAIAEAGAQGATSIDVERGGYEVEVQLADGSEPDLFVGTDGTVTTDADRPDDDDRPDPLLDLGTLTGIEKAALDAVASAGGADGTIDSLSTSDDRGVAYEVSIRLSDGRDADVELASDLTVVSVDLDN
ncbi:hypothetical protein ACFWHT_11440 [Microbacterium sp. NPDC058342]|uniref:hypothetical protein n=1 Tax=Microbacterium sp. NPDC058342 TaxID=3346454 RepID=UPI00364AE762